jgi:hypothetical protein
VIEVRRNRKLSRMSKRNGLDIQGYYGYFFAEIAVSAPSFVAGIGRHQDQPNAAFLITDEEE